MTFLEAPADYDPNQQAAVQYEQPAAPQEYYDPNQQAYVEPVQQPQQFYQPPPQPAPGAGFRTQNEQFIMSDGAPPVIISQGAPQYIVQDPATAQPVVLARPPATTWYYRGPDGRISMARPDMTPRPLAIPQPAPQPVFQSPAPMMFPPQQPVIQTSVSRPVGIAASALPTSVAQVAPGAVQQVAIIPDNQLIHQPPNAPFEHIATLDGFTSPYEPQPMNLNRNPFFKSYYDIPLELREAERPPPDYVIPQDQQEAIARRGASQDAGQPMQQQQAPMDMGGYEQQQQQQYYEQSPTQEYVPQQPAPQQAAPSAGGGQLELQRIRIRIMNQRNIDLKDNGPALQFSDFMLYDQNRQPLDLHDCVANCVSGGFSEDFEDFQHAVSGQPGVKFLRREFGAYPLDLELDLMYPRIVTAYSWRTASDSPSRDPSSWQFQALTNSGWVTLDEVNDYEPPKTRSALCGPFSLEVNDGPQGGAGGAPMGGGGYAGGAATRATLPVINVPINPMATDVLLNLLNQPQTPQFVARVEELLRKGADPNAADARGRTAFLRVCALPYPTCIDLMLRYGADVNAQASSGETGLHRAAIMGDVMRLELLLQRGADPNVQDAHGDTPLMICAACAVPQAVQVLLRYGAQADTRNAKGQTALELLEEECRKQGSMTPASADEVRRVLGGM